MPLIVQYLVFYKGQHTSSRKSRQQYAKLAEIAEKCTFRPFLAFFLLKEHFKILEATMKVRFFFLRFLTYDFKYMNDEIKPKPNKVHEKYAKMNPKLRNRGLKSKPSFISLKQHEYECQWLFLTHKYLESVPQKDFGNASKQGIKLKILWINQ